MQTAVIKKDYVLPPRTAMEVFEMLPEGTLAEVINNTIYMPPSPSVPHQQASLGIASQIHTFVSANNLGLCLTAPLDIYFGDRNVLQPDIIFISRQNESIIKDGKIKGAPDLIIEIFSGNKKLDMVNKKNVYEKFAVKEYFMLDVDTKEVITYYHDNGKYIQQESKKGKLKSKILKKTFSF